MRLPWGMIFASTKLPLRTWFRATCHLTQNRAGRLQHRAGPTLERDADDGVKGQAQAEAGHNAARPGRWPVTLSVVMALNELPA